MIGRKSDVYKNIQPHNIIKNPEILKTLIIVDSQIKMAAFVGKSAVIMKNTATSPIGLLKCQFIREYYTRLGYTVHSHFDNGVLRITIHLPTPPKALGLSWKQSMMHENALK